MSLAAARIANFLRRAGVEARGVTDALLVSLRRAFLLPARRLCNHRHGQKWGAQHSNPIGVRPLLLRAIRREVATMNAEECLKRTAECARLAEATNDPGLRIFDQARLVLDAINHLG